MSTQKGNTSRTRPQKYQNRTKYKNDLHDKNQRMKLINSLEVVNVCSRCKDIIEWKIKYKKYKPLKTPANCAKCHNKNVTHAYHTLCSGCCKNLNVCPKCQQIKELVTSTSTKTLEELLKSSDVQGAVKNLPERKRRTFYRHVNKHFFSLTTEEEILNKIKEMSTNSVEGSVLDNLGELSISSSSDDENHQNKKL